MPPALARHDALAQAAVGRHRGIVVKMIGDGMHAAFDDPLDAVLAILELQRALADPAATDGLPLRVRAGLHAGVVERRDNDYFGTAVNRAARIMGVGARRPGAGVAGRWPTLVASRLPAAVALARPGRGAPARPRRCRARLPASAPGAASGFPGAALARGDAEQPAAADDDLRRARARDRRRARAAGHRPAAHAHRHGRPRQDAAGAARSPSGRWTTIADGVWFVELASLSDPGRVPQAVASVLGVSEEGGRSVMDALLQFVADRSLLVVLDNCEHLVGACAELGDPAAAGRCRGSGSWRPAARTCTCAARRRIRCRRCRCPRPAGKWRPRRWFAATRCACSSIGRSRRSRCSG